MKAPLARFGVAMSAPLLAALDGLVKSRKATRSKVLGDLVRAELMRATQAPDSPAVVTLTLVYDHHTRELTEKLNAMQHELGEKVRATMHVHLSHDDCLEVIVMQGRARELMLAAERLVATRGVKHGGVDLVTGIAEKAHGHAHRKH
jgi:CopG family transcriptional regulator, nickel-responsive regulator